MAGVNSHFADVSAFVDWFQQEEFYTEIEYIDLIHKWRPIYYSFIFMLIRPPSLVSMCKIQKNVFSKMRLGRLISMNMIE